MASIDSFSATGFRLGGVTFTLDTLGLRRAIERGDPGEFREEFSYDSLARLVEVRRQGTMLPGDAPAGHAVPARSDWQPSLGGA